jgi:hypothetical protein
MEKKNGDNDTALHLAARSQQTDIVKLLAQVTLLSLPVELILTVGENLRDAHDLPCHQYRDHAYGDFNAFLQGSTRFSTPFFGKKPQSVPGTPLGESFLALGAPRSRLRT